MFSDSALSCFLLLLASGSSLYLTGKRLSDDFSKIQPNIIAASVGVFAINLRAFFNLLSPFFFHASYSIDPIEIDEEEEEKVISRVCPLHEKFCRVLSNSGFIYAICDTYENRKVGIFIIFTLTFAEVYHAFGQSYPKNPSNRIFHFMWMSAGGLFGWMKGNYYCVYAYFPYGMSFLSMTPEKKCAWSARRIINNYMMMAHVFLMLDAIREVQSVD